MRELRNESRRAQAVDDEEGRQRRIHERRRLRMGVDTDGTFRLSFSGTAVAGAAIVAALRPFTDQAFKQAKKDGRVESHAAYQADGFVAMAQAAAAGGVDGAAKKTNSNVKVIVVVDAAALRRGEVESGETCEIRGVGPVPVATVRELLPRGGDRDRDQRRRRRPERDPPQTADHRPSTHRARVLGHQMRSGGL